MPVVNGKHYAYTPKGIKQAKKAAVKKSTGLSSRKMKPRATSGKTRKA
tara:strand:- start:37 stop:180 length:144 start_codon:yes stop_codon:yes gene_type:complete